MSIEQPIPKSIQPQNPIATAESLFPDFPDDSDKTRYLAFRASGFSITESCRLLNIKEDTLKYWRTFDTIFSKLETQTESTPRVHIALQILQRSYLRNLHLILLQDEKILIKYHENPDSLSEKQHQYLMKALNRYSLQSLQAIISLDNQNSDQNKGNTINFSQTLLQIQQLTGQLPSPKFPESIKSQEGI